MFLNENIQQLIKNNNEQVNYSFWHQQNETINNNSTNECIISSPQIQNEYLNNNNKLLIIIKQPEEQHRARYASEGSRGAIKDRSGTSYCSIKLIGYYRPTRVELFAAEKEYNYSTNNINYIPHSQYKLITVIGKSSIMTPCKKIVNSENSYECLEIILRPENQMVGVLDCIGIMKICSSSFFNNNNNNNEYKKHLKSRKRNNNNKIIVEQLNNQKKENNIIYIVAKAFIPSSELKNNNCENNQKFEIIQTITDPIKCVYQLGNPDILKISFESCTSNGGQELFIIGRNFDPKNTKVLFREYKNDGSLGWSAEAKIDKKYIHQCYIVCIIPPYKRICQGAFVSLTIICGVKQSHPINFLYKPCEIEDDDWRPPDCLISSSSSNNNNIECSSSSSSSVPYPRQEKQNNYFYEGTNYGLQQPQQYSFHSFNNSIIQNSNYYQ